MIDGLDGDPVCDFDEDFAQGVIGKTLLVGIAQVSALGEVVHQAQLHGVIAAATASGIDVELRGVNEGKAWRMAPSSTNWSRPSRAPAAGARPPRRSRTRISCSR